MLKQLWSLLFGCDNEFFKYNVREKMALIIIFVLAILIIVTGKEFETVKYVIVGLLAFLKGNSSLAEINDNKEKIELLKKINEVKSVKNPPDLSTE